MWSRMVSIGKLFFVDPKEKDDNQFKAGNTAWRKMKCRIWKISSKKYNNLVCNITNNIDAFIDKGNMVRFIYNSINHRNKTSSNISRVKILCVNSTYSTNNNLYHLNVA